VSTTSEQKAAKEENNTLNLLKFPSACKEMFLFIFLFVFYLGNMCVFFCYFFLSLCPNLRFPTAEVNFVRAAQISENLAQSFPGFFPAIDFLEPRSRPWISFTRQKREGGVRLPQY